MAALDGFRAEVRTWLETSCPPAMRKPPVDGEMLSGGRKEPVRNADAQVWLTRCAERGFTVPMWPKEYGGAGLSINEYLVLLDEMKRCGARTPLSGMGITMIGPTLLEFGTDEQKKQHLPRIASGEIRWCQGYSEPGSGSDLASLQTRAEDKGDHFVINGSKIWTTLAQYADWMFCLVRTDPKASKHEGISFVLFPMEQAGVSVRPLVLISGNSHFCQCFFDDAIARKEDLIGGLNKGWTVAKRLLQHERSGITSLVGGQSYGGAEAPLPEVAKRSLGTSGAAIGEPDLRAGVISYEMNNRIFNLTQRRTVEESEGGKTPGAATSIFKLYGANLRKQRSELLMSMRGFQALGWEGDAYSRDDITTNRTWLQGKAGSIAGGSNEVQMNIIAKRVLGLPD